MSFVSFSGCFLRELRPFPRWFSSFFFCFIRCVKLKNRQDSQTFRHRSLHSKKAVPHTPPICGTAFSPQKYPLHRIGLPPRKNHFYFCGNLQVHECENVPSTFPPRQCLILHKIPAAVFCFPPTKKLRFLKCPETLPSPADGEDDSVFLFPPDETQSNLHG